MKTLLVGERPITHVPLRQLLERQGHAVTVVGDAREALDRCRREAFPLVVLNCAASGADGPALCRSIRSLPHCHQSVIVVLTAHDEPEHLATILDAGASDYLSPSMDLASISLRLVVAVRQAAERAGRFHDPLTGLPNRALLLDRLVQSLHAAERSHAPTALLLIDLIHFKEVNDTFGHHFGDLLLQEVGSRLQVLLRASDSLARLDGDQFAMLLPTTDYAGAIRVARKTLAALDMPCVLEAYSIEMGASIGIAVYPEHGTDATVLLRRADSALRLAKNRGGGYVLYTPEQDRQAPDRLTLRTELRRGLDQEQLLLHYQPLVDLAHDRLRSVEALVRWQHPERGLVQPDQFIPLAEQSDLIGLITLWVLEAALRQCQIWQQAGLQLDLAVNLSGRTLHDLQLPETVAWLLRRYQVGPERLTLEITESTILADATRAIGMLTELAERGVRIAIDDFGTGYSSLAHLKRLPVHEIKIDKTFVQGMGTDTKDVAIVRSVVELGHNLDLRVVAEGVEQQQAWDSLAAMRCDIAQGYLLSRPLPAADLQRWAHASPWRPK